MKSILTTIGSMLSITCATSATHATDLDAAITATNMMDKMCDEDPSAAFCENYAESKELNKNRYFGQVICRYPGPGKTFRLFTVGTSPQFNFVQIGDEKPMNYEFNNVGDASEFHSDGKHYRLANDGMMMVLTIDGQTYRASNCDVSQRRAFPVEVKP